MDVQTTTQDFSPFPSKMFALLYILLNGPRAMVRMFVCWFYHSVVLHT